MKSTCLTITKELVLEPEPEVPRGAAAFPNNLHKIRGDRVGEPRENDNIHPSPAWVVGEGIIRLDVVGEGISRQGQQHVVTPPGIVVGRGVQNNVHEGTNIRHRSHLDVEVGDDGVFIQRRVGCGLCGQGRRGSQDQLLGGDSLPFEIGGGGLHLIKELMGSQDATMRGGGLLFDNFGGGNQGVEPLLEGLDVGGQKGDDV
jgi:hypothetical protein